ncbi:hypothetical protein F2Q68_00022162 [Brassica cretica]|uniref:Uncharacterized protein n=1 Tax=Brassica cretica TaxID=69181 RepID=A0A8S9FSQ5_BRACR|nr:hypothetical protein F2Q68_00022162 [Brassica cretica]
MEERHGGDSADRREILRRKGVHASSSLVKLKQIGSPAKNFDCRSESLICESEEEVFNMNLLGFHGRTKRSEEDDACRSKSVNCTPSPNNRIRPGYRIT